MMRRSFSGRHGSKLTASASFSSRSLLERRGATAQEGIDLALLGVNAATAAVLDGRADIGPGRFVRGVNEGNGSGGSSVGA